MAASGSLLLAVVVAGVIGGTRAPDGSENSSTEGTGSLSTETYNPVAEVEATPIVKVPLSGTVGDGSLGGDVVRVQTRLMELNFDPGPIDGEYGLMTKQAVWAFEKLVMGVPRTSATGEVSPELWDRMQDPIKVAPRRPTAGLANHTEVYLPEQVLVVFHGDEPVLVTHISTGLLDEFGNPAQYCEEATYDTDGHGVPLSIPVTKAICAFSKTPGGVFSYTRMVAGVRTSPLGGMWNPVYFNYGVAVHGALNVPITPASHGCVRIPMHISQYFQTLVAKGDRILVWDGKKEPELQSELDRAPSWDIPDPNATTTTTSTTTIPKPTPPPATTTTSTTVAPLDDL